MPLPEDIDTGDGEDQPQYECVPANVEPMPGPDVPATHEPPKEFNFVDFVQRSQRRDAMLLQQIEELRKTVDELKRGVPEQQQGQNQGKQGTDWSQVIPVILDFAKPFMEKFAEMMPMAMAEEKSDDPWDEYDRNLGRQVRMDYLRQNSRRGTRYPPRDDYIPRRGYLPQRLEP